LIRKNTKIVSSNGKPENNLYIPFGLTATAGDMEGEVDLVWEPVEGSNSYVVQISRSKNKPANWIQEDVITKSSYTVSRLKSGSMYWFRIAAVSPAGQGIWSEPVNKKAP